MEPADTTYPLLRVGTQETSNATLHRHLSPQEVIEADAIWYPAQIQAVSELLASGVAVADLPRHLHWRWNNKAMRYEGNDAYEFVGLSCEGQMQGMMLVEKNEKTHQSRLPERNNAPLLYVDYIATAPWNDRALVKTPRFYRVGTLLMNIAVAISIDLDFQGYIGLHSLPQAESFYRNTLSMNDLGIDKQYHDLRYFEK
jgi:hypothetical protein